ncbi:hypothetical protein CSQ91_07340 [Janthinobacterium sp. BJB301]|uniref:DUF2798 domain-containing protein n=1 Tax=Janthinobacterium lividum TaxID=29581 RepID=A0AAJ4MNR5_9BURK|nr:MULTISPECIES: DUF2798 domain-containing protein [Janthinobacterium]KAB0325211.1 DUF2798 domain-containing protein [Janthinobacterium lividum]PHV50947.1 hypothetical protein CSQ91_07340 [Janthinobacterium sp. BJB301]QSX94300.1 DUF2798 domain-containing protein [Janthinobacterium lividum]UGQ34076.1 DUF2798 domain-containing protein [Janthinobacterium sp. PLB04]
MSEALRLRCVFAFLMSLVMTLLMSAWVTWLNIGLQADFLPRWRHAFFAAWPVAFCAVMLFAPRVQLFSRTIVARLARPASPSCPACPAGAPCACASRT